LHQVRVLALVVVHVGGQGRHRQAVAVDQRSDRRRQVGLVRSQEQVDPVARDQLLVELHGGGGASLVVVSDQLQLATEEAAAGVDLVHGQLVAVHLVLGRRRVGTGLGHRVADLDGPRGPAAPAAAAGGEHHGGGGQEAGPMLSRASQNVHGGPPLLSSSYHSETLPAPCHRAPLPRERDSVVYRRIQACQTGAVAARVVGDT